MGSGAPHRCRSAQPSPADPGEREGGSLTAEAPKVCAWARERACRGFQRPLGHLPFQAAELAEYTAKIALLEEARRRKEDEVEEWQHRVSHGFSWWGRVQPDRQVAPGAPGALCSPWPVAACC